MRLLGAGLVRVEESKSTDGTEVVIKPITLLPNIIELSYYASALSPVFALDAIVGECEVISSIIFFDRRLMLIALDCLTHMTLPVHCMSFKSSGKA